MVSVLYTPASDGECAQPALPISSGKQISKSDALEDSEPYQITHARDTGISVFS